MGCLMLSSYFDEDKTKNKEVLEYQKNNVGPFTQVGSHAKSSPFFNFRQNLQISRGAVIFAE